MSDTNADPLDFDAALVQLETLAEKLERGDTPIEEALSVYEQAVALYRQCHSRLAVVEQRLETLTRGLDEAADFDEPADDD